MRREWKPGDVALVTYYDPPKLAIVRPRREARGATLEFAYVDGGYDPVTAPINNPTGANARPLAVIDPEDRAQVERFREIASRWSGRVPYSDMAEPGDLDHTDAMQSALREFIAPPKPTEPTGLGAVVEDAEGYWWVSASHENRRQWYRDNVRGGWRDYAEVAAVRVVREGVQ